MPKVKQEYTIISPEMVTPDDDPRQIARVPVSLLEVDSNVQRDTTQTKLDKMGELDWALIEGITVTARPNGSLVVTEGQHRVLKLKEVVPHAHVSVFLNPGENNEAAIALAIAKSRSPHTPLQKWMLNLHKGELMQVRGEEVLARLGLRLYAGGNVHDADAVAAVGAIERVMKLGGPDDEGVEAGAVFLEQAMATLIGAFPGEPNRNDGALIYAVGRLIARNDNIRLQRLVTKMKLQPASKWVARAADRLPNESKSYAIGKAIIDAYNKSLGTDNEIRW